jgi:hypothetical protein
MISIVPFLLVNHFKSQSKFSELSIPYLQEKFYPSSKFCQPVVQSICQTVGSHALVHRDPQPLNNKFIHVTSMIKAIHVISMSKGKT